MDRVVSQVTEYSSFIIDDANLLKSRDNPKVGTRRKEIGLTSLTFSFQDGMRKVIWVEVWSAW